MALTDDAMNSNMIMPVAPMGGNNGFGFGNDGNGFWFLILFFLLCGNNGWGGGFGGGFDGGLYPWMNQSNQINGGFRDQMISTQLQGIQNSVTSGFGDTALGIAGINQNICQTGNGIVGAVNGAQNAITQQMYANQIADMQQSFAAQTAMMQGFNGVQTAGGDALQNVTMQNMGNTNQIVNAINGGIQSIKDQLCDYRNAQKDETIANLRQELMYSRGQASQVEQTAQLLANNNAQTALFQQGLNNEVDALYNRLNSCPVPTTPVYGRTPIFTCQSNGCGCGNNF